MRYAPWLVVFIVACVSTNAMVLNPGISRMRTCPEAVVIYTDSSKVGQPYVDVAILNSRGDHSMTNEQGMMTSQRKKAAELGANGIILGPMTEPTTGAKVWNALIGTAANRKGSAMAIYVPGDSARGAEACRAAAEAAPS